MPGSDPAPEEAARPRAEVNPSEHDELIRLVTEHSLDFVCLHDPDGRTVYTSRSVERLYGRVPANLFELAHPDDVAACRRWWQQVLAGGNERLRWRVRDARGGWRWLETAASLVRFRGRPHVLTACRDITDRERAEEALRQSERRLTEAQRIGHIGHWEYDAESGRIIVSDEACRIFGTTPQQGLQTLAALQAPVHPEDVGTRAAAIDRALREGRRFELEYRVVRPDGEVRTIHSQGEVDRDAEGRPRRLFGIVQDVTERKRAEQELRLIIDTIPAMVFTARPDGYVDYVNRPWQQYRGLSLEGALGSKWVETIHPDDRARSVDHWYAHIAAGTAGEIELRVRRADGVYRWILGRFVPMRDGSGRIIRWYGVSADIDDRKRAEEERRQTTALLQAVIDGTADAVYVKDLEGKYLLFNAAVSRLTGKPAAEVLGRDDTVLFDPDSARAVMEHDRRVMESGAPSTEEHTLLLRGVRRTYLETKFPYRDEHGQIIGVIGISHDITERNEAGEALRRSEELLRRTGAMAHVAGWTLAVPDGSVTVTEEGQRLFGWAPGPRRLEDLMALVHPDDRPRVEAAIQAALAGTPFEAEHRIVVGGEVKWIRRRVEPEFDPGRPGRVVRLVGVSQDITERRKLEEQFRQAQKMEAIGTLAGGVAHDFNNLITIINGYSELLISSLKPGDPMRNLLGEIRKAGERAGALTRQLLMFSRRQVVEPKVLDLNAVVADTDKMLRRLIGEDVVLTAALDPSIPPVKADTGQLQQVLMNLSVNARDAMPRGGRLIVETKTVTLDENYARTHPQVRPGEYVLLAVSDTGTGMDPDTKLRIFEPFFTTKGPGKGTGLGLAVVHGVVTQSEGHIEVDSEVGKGTTFKIYLPAVKERRPAGKSAHGLLTLPRGRETVLLAEDEGAVRALARHVLTSCGYTVLEAADGREAVRVAEQHPGRIDLVVSDVVMPHLGGRQLVERLAVVRPGLKVLFLSGYTDDAVVRHGVLEAEYAFLQKPFTPTALAQKVREVLDQKQ